jgi:predicted transcriptional regulator YdeE
MTIGAYIFTLTALLVSASLSRETTVPKRVHEDGFFIVGLQTRTTNAKEATSAGEIPKLWQKFFQDGIQQKISEKINGTIYAVYTDYSSDRNGEYSFVIGMKVHPNAKPPGGMVLKKIPAGNYAVIASERGPVAKVVPAAWQQIWSLEDKSQLGSERSYRADFELYDERASDPQNSQVDIYIGVK